MLRRLTWAVAATAALAACNDTTGLTSSMLVHTDTLVVYAITGPRVAGGKDRPGSESGGPRQKKSKGSGGSFTNRMEDRFRRRFDE